MLARPRRIYRRRAVGGVFGALVTILTLVAHAGPAAAASPRLADDSPAPLLTVTTHTPSVPRFQQFTYQTGTVPGLTDAVQDEVRARIDAMVNRTVAGARTPRATSCPVGSDPCGLFRQSLRTYACSAASLCIAQEVGLLLPGMNGSQQWVDTLVLDNTTGRPRRLSSFVPRSAMPAFLAATTAAVRGHLATDGISVDPFWKTSILRRQLRAWIPTRAGMRIWFDKYSAGPGSMGVIQVLVPWVPGSGPVPR
jgi:hypothetical protein